jgi:type II secretory pathway component PulF
MPLIITPRQLTKRAQFYHQFSQMTGAGVSMLRTLDMLYRNPPGREYREPLQQIIDKISHGSSVTEAMRSLGNWMPSFDIALVEAGERSGRLDAVFRLLASYYEDRAKLMKRTITDLGYPLLLVHMAVFLFPFISFFTTGNVVVFLAQTFGVLIPIYAVVFAVMYAAQSRRGAVWRAIFEKLVRPIPMLGTARHYLALGRLAAALQALINAGVTIIEAWDLAAKASGSPAIQRAVARWKPEVVAGKTPSEAVSESTQFPELFANLYASGEVSGQLDESLRRLHQYYDEEGRVKLHLVAVLFPRFIYFGVAIWIGYLAVKGMKAYVHEIDHPGGF